MAIVWVPGSVQYHRKLTVSFLLHEIYLEVVMTLIERVHISEVSRPYLSTGGAQVHLRTCMFSCRDKRSHLELSMLEAIGVVNQETAYVSTRTADQKSCWSKERVACVASVSVWFRSKERPRNGILGFDRARNETRAKRMKVGGGGREGRKRLQTNPLILKTCVRQRTQRLIGSASRTMLTCVDQRFVSY